MIALLLVLVSCSASAQTQQDENLQQFISKLRACVRMNAPGAQAAGLNNTNDAVNFFIKTCSPLSNSLSDVDKSDLGAVPPGAFRLAVRDEWVAFVEEARTR